MIALSFILFFAVILGGIAFYIWLRKRLHKKLIENLELKLFLIRLPKLTKEGKDLKQEINLSEQLFAALAFLKKPFIFEVVVPYIGAEINFYLAVPGKFAEAVVRQVQGIWGEAQIEPAPDYNIFNYAGAAAGAAIIQKDDFVLPIRVYEDLNADTFGPILNGLTQVNEVGEGAAIQFLARPAPKSTKKRIQSVLNSLKKGQKLKDILGGSFLTSSDIKEALGGQEKNKEAKERILDESAIKALEMKISKPLFEVNIRLIASAPSQFGAESILDGLGGGFAQFSAPERNEFKVVKQKNPEKLFHKFSFREFDSEKAMVLNSVEFASVFHLPTPFLEIPKISSVKARQAPPPPNLVREGVLIGQSFYRDEVKEIRISDEDRRRHVYIVGQTGTGKTTFMKNMAINDIKRGKGVGLIDPHGEFADEILSLIPKERYQDVIFFDPSDLSRPLGLNMLEYDFNRPEEKTFIVNEMQSIFNKLFAQETMGPMFEQYMRNALLLLMEDAPNESATLMEVARVFTDQDFRERKLGRIHNPTVIDFWQKEAIKAGGEAALSNMTPYITSKFNNFTANDYMRVIIGQAKSAFRFREAMDEKKILLMSLSKGKIGEINANLLGMILVGKILMAALSRVDVPEEKRTDFYLYIDEFQNFTTDSIAVILSEARKYRLDLTIGHQFIAQLAEKIRDAVFGNVGSIVSFRIGAADAEVLEKQFEPVFSAQDLINIDNFNAYVKLLINGETSKPFNIKIIRPESGDFQATAELKELSRTRYGSSREEVEAEIYKRLRE